MHKMPKLMFKKSVNLELKPPLFVALPLYIHSAYLAILSLYNSLLLHFIAALVMNIIVNWFRSQKFFFSMALKPINIRWIITGSHSFWSCITSYYRQFSTNYKIKIIKLTWVLSGRAFGPLRTPKLNLILQF